MILTLPSFIKSGREAVSDFVTYGNYSYFAGKYTNDIFKVCLLISGGVVATADGKSLGLSFDLASGPKSRGALRLQLYCIVLFRQLPYISNGCCA